MVRALPALRTRFPERFGDGAESHLPVFRWAGGAAVTRTQLQEWLRRAALACGVPPARLGTHSLRIGGACAIYHGCRDLEQVRRFGRWATSVFHVYLWEAAGDAKGLAAKMVVPHGTLLASRPIGGVAEADPRAWRLWQNEGAISAF